MGFLHKKMFLGMGLASVLGVGGVIVAMILTAGQPKSHLMHPGVRTTLDSGEETGNGDLSVKTIRPKYDPAYTFSIKEPATVNAYYLSELDAHVVGSIESIHKAAGSPVAAGELLAKISVPDLDQEVALKDALIKQRQAELELA